MVGLRLSQWCKHLNVRPSVIARAASVSTAAVAQWMGGKNNPSQEHLQLAVQALGISMATFYGPIPSGKAGSAKA